MKKSPIVILHGWGLSASRFEALSARLTKEGFKVFTPDFPGFGDTPIPEKPLTLTDYANWLHVYAKKQNIVSPIVIGHSFGGRVALRYSQLYPSEIYKLILTGTPGYTPTAKRKLMFFVIGAKLGKVLFSLPGMNYFQETVRRWYYYVVGAREYYRAKGAMRETFKNIVQEDLVKPMQALTIPTLLVWGADDIITPVRVGERMKETMVSSSLVVIPDSDHGVSFKQPNVFYTAISSFLNS